MYKNYIIPIAMISALALAGCANHVPPAVAKHTPTPATAKHAAPTVPAQPLTKEKAENEAAIDAIEAYGMNDALSSTQDGIFQYVLIGSPVGTIVTATAGRVVRATDGDRGRFCRDYQKQNNGDLRACSVPRVVLVITPCVRAWPCPRSNGAIVAVVPPKDAPTLGDVVTVLRGPVAGMVRVINDGFRVEDGAGSVE